MESGRFPGCMLDQRHLHAKAIKKRTIIIIANNNNNIITTIVILDSVVWIRDISKKLALYMLV